MMKYAKAEVEVVVVVVAIWMYKLKAPRYVYMQHSTSNVPQQGR
jgi:hypothetical protein